MKKINEYINEKLIVNNTIQGYKYHPKDKNELIKCIKEKIDKEGFGIKDKPLNLNDIDTSKITDMSDLFSNYIGPLKELSHKKYFDISDWNVSNVKDMSYMFYESYFNGDISKWNVSNVKNMESMFYNSSFNYDLSSWDVSNVENMRSMFYGSKFTGKNGDISDWDVSNVKDMSLMFWTSHFKGNISDWNVRNIKHMSGMFFKCPLEKNPPKWYKI